MISGTWGYRARFRFKHSRRPGGDGDAIVYVRDDIGHVWIVVLPDGEDVPSLVRGRQIDIKLPGGRWTPPGTAR